MKVFKTGLIVIWGFLTFGLFLYSRQQGLIIRKQEITILNMIKSEKKYPEILDEYYNNFMLIKNDSINKINIDSLYKNSIFLDSYDKSYKRVTKIEN